MIAAAVDVGTCDAAAAARDLRAVVRDRAVFVSPLPIETPHPRVSYRSSEPPFPLCAEDLAVAVGMGAIVACSPTVLLCVALMFWVWKSCKAKVRLIHDMRFSNSFFPEPPRFSLPSLRDVFAPRDRVLPRYAVKIDLARAYWQVPLHLALQERFGGSPDGRSFFTWRVLPFGWTWSPFVFHCIMRCVLIVLWARGVWVRAYMDDIIVLGVDEASCSRDALVTTTLLRSLGFVINVEKSSPSPVSHVRFLGFVVTLTPSRVLVQWPREKAMRVRADATSIADKGSASPRELAALCGRVAFLRLICPIVGALTRNIDFAHQGALHWDAILPLAASLVYDLRVLASLCEDLCAAAWVLHADESACEHVTVEVDASSTGWGSRFMRASSTPILEHSGLLPLALLSASSAVREAYGACRALCIALALLPVSASVVFVIHVVCDNTAVHAVFSRGRSPVGASEEIRRLLQFLNPFASRIIILPVWRPRALLARADTLSRLAARDASLSVLVAASQLISRLRLTRDLFAVRDNAQCPTFVSLEADPLAAACDAFTIDWCDGDYAFPPFGLARRAVQQLITSCQKAGRCLRVALVVPAFVTLPEDPTVSLRLESIDSAVLSPPDFSTTRWTTPLNVVFAHFRSICSHQTVETPFR